MLSWEPLLPDDRVGRIAELLLIAMPDLPKDTDVFSFVVPVQIVPNEDGEPRIIPEQAVFAVKAKNPRTWDKVYQGKEVMSSSGMWKSVWDREEKDRKHYVSTREDPAWSPFYIAAAELVRKLKGYKEII